MLGSQGLAQIVRRLIKLVADKLANLGSRKESKCYFNSFGFLPKDAVNMLSADTVGAIWRRKSQVIKTASVFCIQTNSNCPVIKPSRNLRRKI